MPIEKGYTLAVTSSVGMWAYVKLSADEDRSLITSCLKEKCIAHIRHNSAQEAERHQYTLCPQCIPAYNVCSSCFRVHLCNKRITKHVGEGEWRCGSCRNDIATYKSSKFRYGGDELGDARNPLNAEILHRTAMKLLIVKSPNPCIAACVKEIITHDVVEELTKERWALKNAIVEIMEAHCLSSIEKGENDTFSRNIDMENFIDAVYKNVMENFNTACSLDPGITALSENDISKCISLALSTYLDISRTTAGAGDITPTDDSDLIIEELTKSEKLRFENTSTGFRPEARVISPDNSSHSEDGDSSGADSDDDAAGSSHDKAYVSKIDRLGEAAVCKRISMLEQDLLQVNCDNDHQDKEGSDASDDEEEDPLDEKELLENKIDENDYNLIDKFSELDFEPFFRRFLAALKMREALFATLGIRSRNSERMDMWQRIIHAVHTAKENLIQYFVTMPKFIFDEFYPTSINSYGSGSYPVFKYKGDEVPLCPLHNFHALLHEENLFRNTLNHLMNVFAGLEIHDFCELSKVLYNSTLKKNDSSLAAFPTYNIHDCKFWFDEKGELSEGVKVYQLAVQMLFKRLLATSMELNEGKLHQTDYKPFFEEKNIKGTQQVKEDFEIPDTEVKNMLHDNVCKDESRVVTNTLAAIPAMVMAIQKAYKIALQEDDKLVKEKNDEKLKAQSMDTTPTKEMKKYSHIWLVLCFLHCLNISVGTLYYLHSGQPLREDFERDKTILQDASYLALNGEKDNVDLKNAVVNAEYFGKQMRDPDSEIFKHCLRFFFDPDKLEESRYLDPKSNPGLAEFMQKDLSRLIDTCAMSMYITPVDKIQVLQNETNDLLFPFMNISESFNEVGESLTLSQRKSLHDGGCGVMPRVIAIFGLCKSTEKADPKSGPKKTTLLCEADLRKQLEASLAETKLFRLKLLELQLQVAQSNNSKMPLSKPEKKLILSPATSQGAAHGSKSNTTRELSSKGKERAKPRNPKRHRDKAESD